MAVESVPARAGRQDAFSVRFGVEPTAFHIATMSGHLFTAMHHAALAQRSLQTDPQQAIERVRVAAVHLFPDGPRRSPSDLSQNSIYPQLHGAAGEKLSAIVDAFQAGDPKPLEVAFQESADILSDVSGQPIGDFIPFFLSYTPSELQDMIDADNRTILRATVEGILEADSGEIIDFELPFHLFRLRRLIVNDGPLSPAEFIAEYEREEKQ